MRCTWICSLNLGVTQSAGVSWGSIKDSGTKDSPVFPFTRSSSSSQDRSVPGPCWILPMSFGPVNQQHRRGLLCSSMTWRLRKSPTTCMEVRPPVAKVLILSSMGRHYKKTDKCSWVLLRTWVSMFLHQLCSWVFFKNVGTHVLKLSSWALAKIIELNLLGTWVPTFLN
jgi:hypothetical protein